MTTNSTFSAFVRRCGGAAARLGLQQMPCIQDGEVMNALCSWENQPPPAASLPVSSMRPEVCEVTAVAGVPQ